MIQIYHVIKGQPIHIVYVNSERRADKALHHLSLRHPGVKFQWRRVRVWTNDAVLTHLMNWEVTIHHPVPPTLTVSTDNKVILR